MKIDLLLFEQYNVASNEMREGLHSVNLEGRNCLGLFNILQ